MKNIILIAKVHFKLQNSSEGRKPSEGFQNYHPITELTKTPVSYPA